MEQVLLQVLLCAAGRMQPHSAPSEAGGLPVQSVKRRTRSQTTGQQAALQQQGATGQFEALDTSGYQPRQSEITSGRSIILQVAAAGNLSTCQAPKPCL
jgi:hypothetical protein